MTSTFTAYIRYPSGLTHGLTALLETVGGRLWREPVEPGSGSRMMRELWNPPPNTSDITVEIDASSPHQAEVLIRRALGHDIDFLHPPTLVP